MTEFKIALDWLNALASEKKFFREKQAPSLDTTHQLLSALGRPDHSFDYRVIIGGTAGKGSTARYTEQTLLDQGKSVALISSPHLQVVNERIRIDGQLITQKSFCEAILYIKDLCAVHDLSPTYYEAIVVAGIYLAAQYNVDVLICEVGIGGALDAVNAVQGLRIAAVTFIGEDHLEMFEHSIENLAAAKAGIFTEDSLLNLTYEQKYSSIFEKTSTNKITYLKGLKSKMNKKIARNICEKILENDDFQMQSPRLPARWEKVGDNLILDGAHSGPRFEYILPKIQKFKPQTAILAMSQNHDPETFSAILPYFENVIWTEFSGSISATELQTLHKVGSVETDYNKAVAVAKGKTLVTGSLYLCGYVRERFYPGESMVEQQTEWPIIKTRPCL